MPSPPSGPEGLFLFRLGPGRTTVRAVPRPSFARPAYITFRSGSNALAGCASQAIRPPGSAPSFDRAGSERFHLVGPRLASEPPAPPRSIVSHPAARRYTATHPVQSVAEPRYSVRRSGACVPRAFARPYLRAGAIRHEHLAESGVTAAGSHHREQPANLAPNDDALRHPSGFVPVIVVHCKLRPRDRVAPVSVHRPPSTVVEVHGLIRACRQHGVPLHATTGPKSVVHLPPPEWPYHSKLADHEDPT